jgi:hypothetical protein
MQLAVANEESTVNARLLPLTNIDAYCWCMKTSHLSNEEELTVNARVLKPFLL